jgi:hypothetical protein
MGWNCPARRRNGSDAIRQCKAPTPAWCWTVPYEDAMQPRKCLALDTLLDTAIADALAIVCPVARVAGLITPLAIVGAEDELTGGAQPIARLLFGAMYEAGNVRLLRDWELLQALNPLRPRPTDEQTDSPRPPTDEETRQADMLFDALRYMALPFCQEFRRPVIVREALLLPD